MPLSTRGKSVGTLFENDDCTLMHYLIVYSYFSIKLIKVI